MALPRRPHAAGSALWGFVARRPWLYRLVAGLAARALRLLGRNGRLRWAPLASGWTRTRDLPAPQAATFMSQWQGRSRR